VFFRGCTVAVPFADEGDFSFDWERSAATETEVEKCLEELGSCDRGLVLEADGLEAWVVDVVVLEAEFARKRD